MDFLNKAALLAAAAAALPREQVDVHELGGFAFLRGMSGTERDAWERSLVVGRGKRRDVNTENVRAKLVARCLCDAEGTRILTDADAVALGGLRVDVLQRLFEVAQRLCGVSDADVEELGNASAPEAGTGSPSSLP